ncbi:hypothetical protein ACUY3K_00145 [Corynebacterium uberis]|uniref:hypothetical protein n=1 Tax=Corynebacterium TaxID=1716 RepID=UPI001D0BE460|nr:MULTISPECIES: hypothetical protein [Corynebacterium]MCZ9309155.1 hypothetical protein [Corynebacterium sp. c6VSa_13]UDL74384.1 hypothetical protein LH391_04090 [Corynebacterium uberis]UDL76782.1 hypothetical protein LH393_05305 [Corynebacterium uberis]UDL78995.1 hypothetical protein LH394_05295 [Corynebacterium uberis]UDL81272.1 hypothetical protein LH392_05715 [Corynebacterium uberis]
MTDPFADTATFPTVEVDGEEPERTRGVRGLWPALGILIALVVAALLLGVGVYNIFLRPTTGHENSPAAGVTSTATSLAPATTPAAPATSSAPASSAAHTTPESPTTEPTTEPTSTPSSTAEQVGFLEQCGKQGSYAVYRDSEVTSCGFAQAVAKQFRGHEGTKKVESPVTGQKYEMTCIKDAHIPGVVRCTGGNNAVVVLQRGGGAH